MKKYIYLILAMPLLFGAFSAHAQSTISPDTVCAGTTVIYDVDQTAGSTYNWTLKGGTSYGSINAVSGRTDSISITYTALTGTDTLLLVETGITGCKSDTVKLAILKLPAISVAISGTDSICINNSSIAQLRLTFTGTPPFSCTYTDGTTPVVLTGISTNPYLITSPVYTTTGIYPYSITSASGVGACPANISGTASIRVFPKPNPGAIKHY
jgi:hypothetical protein